VKHPANIKIDILSYPVRLGFDLWHHIDLFIQPFLKSGGIYVLTDHNTHGCCLTVLKENIPLLADQPEFSILPGEASKDLSSLDRIWNWLIETGAGKDSLLINVGGGMVSDLGGFAAATFNRGMPYINLPTSLIGQVDAAIGGKTGINVSGIKNQAGLMYDPAAVFICPEFLDTLPDAHYKSGIAEIIKCAALSGPRFWKLLKKNDVSSNDNIYRLIIETLSFKCRVVAHDPSDLSSRKMLNFGHTVGHALESISNGPYGNGMLHGQAVAAGMICEAYLSNRMAGLDMEDMDEIIAVIKSYFEFKPIEENLFNQLIRTIQFDKKKTGRRIGFSLLESPGKHSVGLFVKNSDIIHSLEFYNDIIQH
jgi:3-dehydroquinate synthase